MKSLLIAAALFGSMANAATLKCWNRYSSSRTPVLTADIVSNSELKAIQTNHGELDNTKGSVNGKLITTGRSPYKDNQRFQLANAKLVLPVSLANEDLKAAQEAGENGFEKGTNGVIIGSYRHGGDGAGNHYSIRMRCRSYAR